MFLIFYLSAMAALKLQRLSDRFAPSNVLVRQIRARGSVHAALAAPTLAGIYVACAGHMMHLDSDPRPLWLNVLIILVVWNAIKFVGLTLRSISDVVFRGTD